MEKVRIDFSYTDEFGDSTTLVKEVSEDYMGEAQLGVLNSLFHDFVLACGFTFLSGKRVEWVDDDR